MMDSAGYAPQSEAADYFSCGFLLGTGGDEINFPITLSNALLFTLRFGFRSGFVLRLFGFRFEGK
jgi:hypothetical protein